MSSKQSLRLPIDLAKRLNAYLRAASAQAARGRLDPAPSDRQRRREAFERLLALIEPNAETWPLEDSPPERDEDSRRAPTPAQEPQRDNCRCR
ncbi:MULTISPECIES: hypothetical protein [unclassified Pseudomonas]|uniref:hypothetical protein n=1 Tax=unclassified Pseudomonas TaxID=196821 RepID=UPI001EE0249F|nr:MULTISPECIES: hypothetical protein [unclassified Pseudomonas]MCG4453032.1 hypothetical protein [Pseudomonas sp. MMS21 TM103]